MGDRNGDEAARRVVLCLAAEGRNGSLAARARAAGLRVETVDPTALGDDLGDATVVIDDVRSGWQSDVHRVLRASPGARVLLVTDLTSGSAVLALLAAGVSGVCRPTASDAAIVRTLAAIDVDGVAIPRDIVAVLVERLRSGPGASVRTTGGVVELTVREWHVLRLMIQRRSTREIAEQTFVSVGTVRSHIAAVVHKLGAKDRQEAVALAESGALTVAR